MAVMSHRERQLATIRHQQTDRISVDVISIETIPEIAAYLSIDAAMVYTRLGIDGRMVSAEYLRNNGHEVSGSDFTEWGTINSGDYGTARSAPLAGAVSVQDIERYPFWPDPSQRDYAAAATNAATLARQYATRGPVWTPLFCQLCDLMGMEKAMVKMHMQPALFAAALERIYHIVFDYSRCLMETCGDALDIYCIGDDFATQRGMMISPEAWRRWLKPYYAQLFALAKTQGKLVWFHSCGDITPVLPDLIDIGVDVWETVQLHTLPISPKQLKQEYGSHLTFFGGINTQQLPFSTHAQVAEETRSCIEIFGKGGGYICGPDHHIKPDVPARNTITLFDTATSMTGAW